MLRETFGVVVLLVAGCLASDGPICSCHNPQTNRNQWAVVSPQMCSGHMQSPIHLDSDVATDFSSDSGTIADISESPEEKTSNFTATNNGHTLSVDIPHGAWRVTLNSEAKHGYKVCQFHFHWGSVDTRGSEHALDNKNFPLEMHIISYSSMYATFAEAKSAPGGLAVIGVFFHLTTDQAESSLSEMGNLLSSLGGLSDAGSNVSVTAFSPDVLLPQNKEKFFRYQGSLTTPPCTENVQWTVMRQTLRVTNEDLVKLRSLRFGASDNYQPLEDNFRPLQPLNPRGAVQPRVLYKT